jgi:putative salt-induced outer membrane protein
MDRNMKLIAAVFAIAACASAQAEWKGKGEAGLVFARGNTQTDSINLKLEMSEEVDLWKHALDMSALRATTSGTATANRYQAGWQSNYKFSDRGFWFGGLRYEKDRFSGFDYQANTTAGVGYKFINTDKVKLTGQAGVGYRRLKNSLTGATAGDAIGTVGVSYENQLNASTKVVDKFRLESGSNNTLLGNFLGLEVKMNEKLALSVGLDVRNNSKPPAKLKKTDTLTTANLVYSF